MKLIRELWFLKGAFVDYNGNTERRRHETSYFKTNYFSAKRSKDNNTLGI